MIKQIRRLFCKHKNTIVITNLNEELAEQHNCKSISICKDCHKLIKSDKLDLYCHTINFEPY